MLAATTPLDLERARNLRQMKIVATGLLVVVALIFIASRWFEERQSWASYVTAFAEAAMVGALADWFAVTALFRHPLGIPLPHTAIIPTRKDQIGESLGEFVESNFLTRELLDERLSRARIGARVGEWLTDPVHAARAGQGAADALRGTIDVLDDDAIAGSIEAMVERRLRETPVAPLVGRAIDLALEGGHHQRLLDSLLVGARDFLVDNEHTFRSRLEHESPWWIPEPIDDRIFRKIFTGVERFLADIGNDPSHEVRRALDERIVVLADRLRIDPVLMAKGEELKEELLRHPDVRAWIASLWGELKATLVNASADPGSELRLRLTHGLGQLGERLRTESDLQHKVDTWVASAGAYVIDNYRGEVADLISSTVQRWDGATTTRRLELQVGRDLQFIRINGTIVGGLAGLIIHTVSELGFT